jgi:hypothetical protein
MMMMMIIIIIGATALFEPRPSLEASANCPYSLQHSSSFYFSNWVKNICSDFHLFKDNSQYSGP